MRVLHVLRQNRIISHTSMVANGQELRGRTDGAAAGYLGRAHIDKVCLMPVRSGGGRVYYTHAATRSIRGGRASNRRQ